MVVVEVDELEVLDDRVLGPCSPASRRRTGLEREAGVPATRRSRQIEPTTGRFLFALAAAQAGVEVLEIGGSRGYSTIWLAAGARILGGRVVSLEHDPEKCAAWRTNVAEAGLEEWAELVEGDAFETLRRIEDVFDLVFLDAEKDDYEALFALARPASRARRARRRRQRALPRRRARGVLGGAPERFHARLESRFRSTAGSS